MFNTCVSIQKLKAKGEGNGKVVARTEQRLLFVIKQQQEEHKYL